MIQPCPLFWVRDCGYFDYLLSSGDGCQTATRFDIPHFDIFPFTIYLVTAQQIIPSS